MTNVFRFIVFTFLLCSTGTLQAADSKLRLIVISDLNGSYGSFDYGQPVLRAVERIIELKPDLVLITGDLIAGQRTSDLLVRTELEAMWQSFDAVVASPLRQAGIHLLAVPGNHDASAQPKFKLERDVFQEYWQKNTANLKPLAQNSVFQWALGVQNLTLIGLDATRHGHLKPMAQQQWLENTLKMNAKDSAGVIIVAGHLPIRPFARGRETGILNDSALEQLLAKNNVDAYISGHHHAYYPGTHGNLVQISMAALGSGQRSLIGEKMKSRRSILQLDISKAGDIERKVWTGPFYRELLNQSSLPASIKLHGIELQLARP